MTAVYALQPILHNGVRLEPGDEIPAEFVYHGKPRTTDLEALIAEGLAERTPSPPPPPSAAPAATDGKPASARKRQAGQRRAKETQ